MSGWANGGFSTERLGRLDDVARLMIDQGAMPGAAMLVWRRGGVAKLVIEGAADVARGVPLARDSVVRIASMTKPVVSVAALILLERGVIALDDPVARWLPEFGDLKVLRHPAGQVDEVVSAVRAPTLYDLIRHTAGFTGLIGPPSPLTAAIADAIGPTPFISRPTDEFVARVAALPLVQQPGRGWHYGMSTDLLGVVVARAAGRDLPSFLRRELFEPLGMHDTGFSVAASALPRLAVGYARGADGELTVQDEPATGRWSAPPVFASGGGGLVSTLDDYLAFARMLLGGGAVDGTRILSRHAVEAMTAGHLTPEQRQPLFPVLDILAGRNFGLGVSVRQAGDFALGSAGSYGWPGVYGTDWFNDPAEELIAILFTQVWFGGGPLRTRFANLIYQSIE